MEIDTSDATLLHEAATLILTTIRKRLQRIGQSGTAKDLVMDGPNLGEEVGYEYYRVGLPDARDLVRIGGICGTNTMWDLTRGEIESDALEKLNALLTGEL